jgi:methylmalonyl-CoA mutase
MRIEEAAARRQARIDSGQETIVGLNGFIPDEEPSIEILEVDNTSVRQAQIKRLKQIRKKRNESRVKNTLNALSRCMESGEGNLLELAVTAARERGTLGEISLAIERVCGRFKPEIRIISGIYSSEYAHGENPEIEEIRRITDEFAEREGRRPRILVAKMGQDGHDRGAKVVATAYADMGFDVDIGPLFQTPEETARQAVENDVHIVGISSLAGGHKTLLPRLAEELKKLDRGDIILVCGGVVPARDHDFLFTHGVAAIFGPGTRIPATAREIMKKVSQRFL